MFEKGYTPWNKGAKGFTTPGSFKKGQIPHNKGKSCSKEIRKKMKKSGLLKWQNPKYRQHMIDVHKGQFVSEETRKKLRARKASIETRRKMSEALKGKDPVNRKSLYTKEIIKKRSEALKGEKCHWWKGGITPINRAIRHSLEFKLWHKDCFERDNFTCQKYGIRGGELVVHHINNFAEFPELRFAIDNGITLSDKAHREFHKKYGMKNNTKEQIEEFLNNN